MGSDIKYNGHGIFWGIISKYMSRDWRQPSELYPVLLSAAEFRAAFPLTELSWRKIRSFLVKLTLLLGTYSSRNTVCVCVCVQIPDLFYVRIGHSLSPRWRTQSTVPKANYPRYFSLTLFSRRSMRCTVMQSDKNARGQALSPPHFIHLHHHHHHRCHRHHHTSSSG